MDDSTKTMMLSLASGAIKKGLMTLGATAATHGLIASNQTETFVAAGMFLVGAGWSFWNDYGRAIVISKLEVLKAQSMAQAAKLQDAGISAPTVTEIAAQHPTLTATEITKRTDTVVKILLAAFVLSVLFLGSPASAKEQRAKHTSSVQHREKTALVMLTGNLKNDLQNLTGTKLTGSVAEDLIAALDTKLLPDLKYAKLLADASGSKVTAPCWQAWADVITIRQKAVQDQNGQDVPMPDPAVITKFEKLVEIRNMLQPDSDFMIKCSPVASMVGKDIRGLMGLVVSGGAGLAALGIGL